MSNNKFSRIDPNRYPYLYQSTENLPERQRRCTDSICIALYLVCLIGAIGIAGYGITTGDPTKIVQPFDSVGNACGRGPAKDFPYLFFNNPDNEVNDQTICVKRCPKAENEAVACYPNTQIRS